jgi:hypothetical protein
MREGLCAIGGRGDVREDRALSQVSTAVVADHAKDDIHR